MASYNVKPSKPVALFGAVGGMAMLAFVLLSGIGRGNGFVWLWAALCVGVVGFNLWAAFSKRGATEVVERRTADEP
ncbi:hypothetical protein [Amycolatopsis regifaucium]|uniref:DUF2530 domain-containing protein n=1 Tax=Amycolatopsis regifaucium TaxID=546365 RepID=A0A154MVP9_9PSEU|nr:hypothetical protein [Amycolatopsis regifaucium]KZB88361.1 hypothetical protein AVL48_20665 [Amycolatopsis regifaucium]OKA11471.1 hypothetical protein ATP06_0201055 [Amycolatopsis regifaucium]SFH40916.1 hypothetical protein SAMN04489731_10448 [Amycolatopsis regifaucium]